MSRSGYTDDCDGWDLIRWRGAVASAIRGRRGQAFLKEMLAALDKMESKRLISHDLVKDGEACAIGAVALARGLDVSDISPENIEGVAWLFGISDAMAKEIVFENDEAVWNKETPEQRYDRMRRWVVSQIATV